MNMNSMPPDMQAGRRRRHQIITAIVLGTAVVLIFLLATSVGSVRLLDGQPFSLPVMTRPMMASGSMPGMDILMIIMRIALALAIIALPFYIILSILTKEGRRQLLRNIIILALLMTFVYVLRNIATNADGTLLADGMKLEMPTAGSAGDAKPLPDFTPNPSNEMVLAVTLAISLILVGLAAAMIWLIASRRQQPPSSMQALADEAQQAINTIQAGGRLEDAITRCYREMCNVLQKERGIERGSAMTPSEFEQVLQSKGLPGQAVHQLTRLFEDIRYGSKPAGAREEQLAIDSLTAIAAACSHPQRALA